MPPSPSWLNDSTGTFSSILNGKPPTAQPACTTSSDAQGSTVTLPDNCIIASTDSSFTVENVVSRVLVPDSRLFGLKPMVAPGVSAVVSGISRLAW